MRCSKDLPHLHAAGMEDGFFIPVHQVLIPGDSHVGKFYIFSYNDALEVVDLVLGG
jgi:hypothetical protein